MFGLPRRQRLERAVASLVLAAAALLPLAQGCGNDEPALFIRPFDAGQDAEPDADIDAGDPFDPTIGGPCIEDAQCDDAIDCTFDRCDPAIGRCRNTPDDTLCADPLFCNGREKCVLRLGCTAGPVETCQDGNVCTVDRCDEASTSCVHDARDADGDGDPDFHCVGTGDCDDSDPTVSSKKTEICENFKDDDCDGLIDEQPCARAASDTCETALEVAGAGTFVLDTVASKKDYTSSCAVQRPASSQDVVMAITVPGAAGDPARDVEVWATARASNNEVSLALREACTDGASEIACAHIDARSSARAIRRSAPAGSVVYAIVGTQSEGKVDVKVTIGEATSKPSNESCAAPDAVAIDTPFEVSLIDPAKDLPSACPEARTGERTYAFTLTEPRDVKIFASTSQGAGQPVVSMRDADCTSELRCRAGTTPPVFARSLPAGTHVFAVSGTAQIDASILVKTYPATTAPPNQSCATAPPLPVNTSFLVDLANQEDAIANGCLPGGPAAAYTLTLTEPSDVLVIGRFPANEQGAVSLNGPLCTTGDVLACAPGNTPTRVSRRNLPAGSYRVVIADQLGQNVELTALVRKAAAPTLVSGVNDCTAPGTIAAQGGFYTGTTASGVGRFDAGCDAPGMPIGGAPDHLLRFDLAARARVVFDMTGSSYTTLLDVRRGATCPGAEITGACFVGFGPNRSFLDLVLDAGTYWVQVDGYAGEAGTYGLDVRVLPPPP